MISSREELDIYLESEPDKSLTAACGGYDEAYFADRQLVLLLTVKYRSAGSYSGNVLLPMESGSWSAEKTGDSSWTLRVQDMIHDDSASDVVRQHIVLELPGKLIADTDTITLIQEP